MYTTRSGRTIKKPVVYVPQERPEDDFKANEYDSEEDSDVSDEEEEGDEEEEDDDEDEDADENGNLKGFVIDDEDEDEECD